MSRNEEQSPFSDVLRELDTFLAGRLRTRGKGRASASRKSAALVWKGILSFFLQRKKTAGLKVCDVLLVHPSRKSYLQGRKESFIEALRSKGMTIEEIVEDDDLLVRGRLFSPPPCRIPLRFRWHASHAAYLLDNYQFKVIITERNGWIVPTFLKAFRQRQEKVVHLAHSVLTAESSNYGYYDYDYYAVFGPSSYEYLSNLEFSFGNCLVSYAGPYFFNDAVQGLSVSPIEQNELTLLFLAPGPSYEQEYGYHEKCAWIKRWLESNKAARLIVKVHPRGSGQPWEALRDDNTQVCVLSGNDVSLSQAALQCDLVLTGYTNAVIDVTRVGVPFILLGDSPDYFSSERFFMPRVLLEEHLAPAIEAVLKDKSVYSNNAFQFYSYHVENRTAPLKSLVDLLDEIVTTGSADGAPVPQRFKRVGGVE
ncbi:hypothetical protein [Pseudomonas matsuisoli]|uniref:hypothetical protein n=1 Tax=Pseudomonas matsuisoli TaxID=1515666 RepID=UPI0016674DF3|nr:hypothetical protein [Pseudomonas matsuisoli]